VGLPNYFFIMKLIFVTANPFPFYRGGMENWLYNIIRQAEFYSIDIETIAPKGVGDPLYDLKNAAHYRHNPEGNLVCKSKGVMKRVELLYRFLVWTIVTSRVIISKHKSLKDEVALFIGVHTIPSMLPLLLAKLICPNLRFIAYARGRVGDDLLRENRTILATLYLFLERHALNQSEEVFSNGYDTTDYIKRLTKKKITTLPNGVDYFKLTNPRPQVEDKIVATIKSLKANNNKIILCLGTVRPVKGVHFVIEAAAHLKMQAPRLFENLMFVFVGKGDIEKYLALARDLNISGNVHFLGQTINVPEVLALADVATAVSGGGGFSNAAIEMMAAGLPIVGWDSDTYSQLIESGQTGHLVPPFDAKALATGIQYLLEDPIYADFISRNAQVQASKYDWALIAEKFFGAAESAFN
jgi:glycosyltransferase involved in cell wall biosynthesis